jgi:phage I-like protein
MEEPNTQTFTGSEIGIFAVELATAQDAQDGGMQWIQILPVGEFAARDGRGPWRLKDPEAVIRASLAYAGSTDIVVDYEHQTDHATQNGQPAPAAGWIRGFKADGKGIWGLVEWTEKARAFLDNKEYRYLSPAFHYAKTDGAVTRLLRASLTNNPALELTALAKMEDGAALDPLAELRAVLGLESGADVAILTATARQLMTQRVSTEAAHQATAAELLAMRRETEETVLCAAVDAAIDGGHILPHWRDWSLSLARHDRKAFDEFVTMVSPFFVALRGTQTRGLPPEARGVNIHGAVDADELAICRALGHSEDDLKQYGSKP